MDNLVSLHLTKPDEKEASCKRDCPTSNPTSKPTLRTPAPNSHLRLVAAQVSQVGEAAMHSGATVPWLCCLGHRLLDLILHAGLNLDGLFRAVQQAVHPLQLPHKPLVVRNSLIQELKVR